MSPFARRRSRNFPLKLASSPRIVTMSPVIRVNVSSPSRLMLTWLPCSVLTIWTDAILSQDRPYQRQK